MRAAMSALHLCQFLALFRREVLQPLLIASFIENLVETLPVSLRTCLSCAPV